MLAFVREAGDNVVLVVVNLGDRTFGDHGYGVRTGGRDGRWTQVLCTQDARSAAGTAPATPSTSLDTGRRAGLRQRAEVERPDPAPPLTKSASARG